MADPRQSRLRTAWKRLEQLPAASGLATGLFLGALGGWLALYQPGGVPGLALGLVVLALAVPLAFLGRAVVAPLPELAPEPAPQPLPFSVVEEIPGLAMVVLPAGEFRMGSPEDDESAYENERPQHPVRVEGFRMGQTPVTRALYRAVMGKGRPEWDGDEQDGELPANYMTWGDAVRFCNALSKRQGLTRCYRRVLVFWRWNRKAAGYRLPTEAEWEYAARAGSITRWFFGDEEKDLGDYAWFDGNSGHEVHPVAEKGPNPWGLYDMLGNVWEWCWDRYGGYTTGLAENPAGPAMGLRRVVRGGSAWLVPRILRSAYRGWYVPLGRRGRQGFRCLRVPGRQS
jgi:formylglycine-generating enzyme required for sulfatase activity